MGGRGANARANPAHAAVLAGRPPEPEPEPIVAPAATEQDDPAPQPAPQATRVSDEPLLVNAWGGLAVDAPVYHHPDDEIGVAIRIMGADARLDIDGHALGNVLGRIATDAVAGRTSTAEAIDRLRHLRDQLPADSSGYAAIDDAIGRADAPASPPPAVAADTLAPLRTLAAELHQVPAVRRDPDREPAALARILDGFAAGRTGGGRLIAEVRRLREYHHDSTLGKFEIDRAVDKAVAALEAMQRNDSRALHPPQAGRTRSTEAKE